MPHLQVALEMLKQNKPVNVGDHIPYIICKEGPEGSGPAQRAHHPDDLLKIDAVLTIDYEWYLINQILPPISRLLEPIEGTSPAIISEQLGLDSSKYSKVRDEIDTEDCFFTARSQMKDSERFKDCAQLMCKCKACGVESPFPGLFCESSGMSGLNCTSCGAMHLGRVGDDNKAAAYCYTYLSNRITLLVRKCVKQYYDCWLVCDDPACARRTTQQSVTGYRCVDDCHGHMLQEYDDSTLHTQLKYLASLFDYDGYQKKLKRGTITTLINLSPDDKEVFKLLHQHMTNSINGSAYNWIRPSLWTAILRRAAST